MPKFIVNVREVHVQFVEIDAASEVDAIEQVSAGDGTYVENGTDYRYTLDTETWTAEAVPSCDATDMTRDKDDEDDEDDDDDDDDEDDEDDDEDDDNGDDDINSAMP